MTRSPNTVLYCNDFLFCFVSHVARMNSNFLVRVASSSSGNNIYLETDAGMEEEDERSFSVEIDSSITSDRPNIGIGTARKVEEEGEEEEEEDEEEDEFAVL